MLPKPKLLPFRRCPNWLWLEIDWPGLQSTSDRSERHGRVSGTAICPLSRQHELQAAIVFDTFHILRHLGNRSASSESVSTAGFKASPHLHQE